MQRHNFPVIQYTRNPVQCTTQMPNPWWTPVGPYVILGHAKGPDSHSREVVIDNRRMYDMRWSRNQPLDPYGEYYPRAVNDPLDKQRVYNSGSYLTI